MTATIFDIPDFDQSRRSITQNSNGEAAAAGSKPVTLSTENKAILTAIQTNTAAIQTLLDALTDNDGNIKAAFYYGVTALDPSAAGAVIGGTAAGAALAFAPVTGGGLAKSANPAKVSDGDVVNSAHDLQGKQVVVPAIRDLKSAAAPITITSGTETTIVTAGGANVFNDLYRLIITNTSASAVNVTIRDDTAGTIRYVFAVPAGQTTGFSCDAGSATRQSAANKPWTAQLSSGVTSVIITAEVVANL